MQVDADNSYCDVLMQLHFFSGVFHEVVGKFADVHESFGVDAYIDEAAEVGDVCDDARENHADLYIFEFLYIFGEFEDSELLARVTAWLVQL